MFIIYIWIARNQGTDMVLESVAYWETIEAICIDKSLFIIVGNMETKSWYT